MMRNAILYGIEHQMIKGEFPDVDAMSTYKPWAPEVPLSKVSVAKSADGFSALTIVPEWTPAYSKQVRGAVETLADWPGIRMEGDRRVGQHHLRVYVHSHNVSAQIARISSVWDVKNVWAIAWASKNAANLVTNITNNTKKSLRKVIANGLKDGSSIPQIGRKIRPLVGLNAVQIRAYQNLSMTLAAQGIPTAQAQKILGKYSKKARRYRAEMIARTETARAVSEGTLRGYKEADVKKIRFESAADACIVCLGYDGNIYSLSSGSGLIPVHPNCRCVWVPIVRF